MAKQTTVNDGEIPSTVNFITKSTASSIRLDWDKQYETEYINYDVKYRVDGIQNFEHLETKQKFIEINDLKSDTLYNVNIYGISFKGDSSVIVRDNIKTDQFNFTYLRENAILVRSTLKVDLYKLEPAHVDSDEEGCVRTCYMIAKDMPSHQRSTEKTLLVLGATGSGKSTFIDALFNYVTGVSMSDEFRYSIIQKNIEEEKRESRKCESQTRSVVQYKLPKMDGLKIDFPMNIIDTPGFNDTTSKDFDKRTYENIHDLFERKIDHLDAILLVVPASTSRLITEHEYVFSCIRKMFGEDVKRNIIIIITYYDGGPPCCLAVLESVQIPCENVFLFNNSNVFNEIDNFSHEQSIWQERAKSFANLFNCLEKVQKTTVLSSLKVMRARIMLELQLTALEDTLSKQIQDVANYKKAKIIESKKKDNEDLFTLEIAISTIERKFTGKMSINCLKCLRTCHESCWVPANSFIRFCEIMCSMKCTICKCEVEYHHREKEIYTQKTVWKEVSEIEFLKTLPNLQKSFVDFIVTFFTIDNIINELKLIALFPDVLSTTSYIERIIQREENEKKPEFEVRVKLLERVVKHLNSNEAIRNLSYEYLTKDI